MNTFAAILMLLSLISAILSKYLTTVRTLRLRERLLEAETEARAARGRLKAAENEKALLERNVAVLERQKTTLDRKIQLCTGELEALKQ